MKAILSIFGVTLLSIALGTVALFLIPAPLYADEELGACWHWYKFRPDARVCTPDLTFAQCQALGGVLVDTSWIAGRECPE
jgi:hypothetical protein